jgi:hypothetical protein
VTLMDLENLPFFLFGCIPTALFFSTLYSWRKDYLFYEANNRDYSKDSGRDIWYGTVGIRLGKMPNEEKMRIGYLRIATIFFADSNSFILSNFVWLETCRKQ